MANDEWRTPIDILDAARYTLGGYIDLDPASTAEANKDVRARKFYTKGDDGLSLPWYGRIFLNPPYSRGNVEKFTERVVSVMRGKALPSPPRAVVVVNASTSSKWFHYLVHNCQSWVLTRGRIAFIDEAGRKQQNNPVGQAIFLLHHGHMLMTYAEPLKERFCEAFSPYGSVIRG